MPAMRDFFQRRGKFRPEQADEERVDLQIPEDLWIKCPKLRRADLLAGARAQRPGLPEMLLSSSGCAPASALPS